MGMASVERTPRARTADRREASWGPAVHLRDAALDAWLRQVDRMTRGVAASARPSATGRVSTVRRRGPRQASAAVDRHAATSHRRDRGGLVRRGHVAGAGDFRLARREHGCRPPARSCGSGPAWALSRASRCGRHPANGHVSRAARVCGHGCSCARRGGHRCSAGDSVLACAAFGRYGRTRVRGDELLGSTAGVVESVCQKIFGVRHRVDSAAVAQQVSLFVGHRTSQPCG